MVDETDVKHKQIIYEPKAVPSKIQHTKSLSGHV